MEANIFFDALLVLANKRVRISFAECLKLYLRTFPEQQGKGENKFELSKLLKKLSALGKIKYIKSSVEKKPLVDEKGFEHQTEIPGKIEIVRGKKDNDSNKKIPFELYPGFEFAKDLRGTNQKRLELIIRFVFEKHLLEPIVPLKERSLDIFKDEKELDELLKSRLVKSNLDLKRLGCERVVPPLTFSGFNCTKKNVEQAYSIQSNKRILILENFSSYWSFEKWNQEYNLFNQIVYGAGTHFQNAHEYLEEIAADIDKAEFYYLGDLDRSGIMIPYKTNIIRKEWGLSEIKPLTGVYHILLNKGFHAKDKEKSNYKLEECKSSINDWFRDSSDLAEKILKLIQSGQRIAQENFGYRELCELKRNLPIN